MDENNILSCFNSYDIRGKLGVNLNEDLAHKIGYAVAQRFDARQVVLGYDARESSPVLSKAVSNGIRDYGSDVISIGRAGTEEMYSAVTSLSADAGIEVTASHNPIEYNGFKIVKNNSQPLTQKEFSDIKSLVKNFSNYDAKTSGIIVDRQSKARDLYIKNLLSFVNLKNLKPLRIVLNSGNGAAGPTIDKLTAALKQTGLDVNFIKLHHEPDPTFPNGIPNPLLKENQSITSEVVSRENADFGVAFDGDFDRCFLFDDLGKFIPGEYIIGILAEHFLEKEKSGTIIHDPRVVWNIQDIVKNLGGNAYMAKTGHSFVKLAMRDKIAIYGGEISAHHYFRDFFYCDSGMIPWLVIWELLSKKNLKLSELVANRKNKFPSSGEINFSVSNPENCLKNVKKRYFKQALHIDETDGISLSFGDWRFNLRKSNTEPLVRLNVEARNSKELLDKKTQDLQSSILND